jgi:hypothetical protein
LRLDCSIGRKSLCWVCQKRLKQNVAVGVLSSDVSSCWGSFWMEKLAATARSAKSNLSKRLRDWLRSLNPLQTAATSSVLGSERHHVAFTLHLQASRDHVPMYHCDYLASSLRLIVSKDVMLHKALIVRDAYSICALEHHRPHDNLAGGAMHVGV